MKKKVNYNSNELANKQAANPGAEMEDFVRWHSPRDWIEDQIVTSEGPKTQGKIKKKKIKLMN